MPFTLEDILEDMAEASKLGRREWHPDDQYAVVRRGCVRSIMTPEQYRHWLLKCARANRKYYLKNKAKFTARVRKYNRTPAGRASCQARAKRWRLQNQAKTKAYDKQRRALLKADPARLEKKRQQDRESQRRRRAGKKNGLQR